MLHLEPGWRELLRRGIRRGMRTLRREHDWSGSLGALLGTFILLQMLVVGLTCTIAAETQLKERTQLQLELLGSVPNASISDLMSTLQGLPYVSRVAFMTKEQAYDHARKSDPQLIGFLEQYGLDNPFHDAVTVTLSSLNQYGALLETLQDPRWQNVVDPSFLSDANAEQQYVMGLLRFTQGMRSLALFVLGIGMLTLLFIVMNLTRTRSLARSQEVLVERLVGAQSATILIPFIVEATVLLCSAAVASTLLATAIVASAPFFVPALQGSGIFRDLWIAATNLLVVSIPIALLIELMAIPLLAWLGAWLGIGKHIQNPRIAVA